MTSSSALEGGRRGEYQKSRQKHAANFTMNNASTVSETCLLLFTQVLKFALYPSICGLSVLARREASRDFVSFSHLYTVHQPCPASIQIRSKADSGERRSLVCRQVYKVPAGRKGVLLLRT